MTFWKVCLANRVNARLSLPLVTTTAKPGQPSVRDLIKCGDYSSPTGVSAVSPILWIALVNTCLAAIDLTVPHSKT